MKAKYLETEKILYLFADQDFDTQKVKNTKRKSVISLKPEDFKEMKYLLNGDIMKSGIIILNDETCVFL
ncbi:MAG: hypothetical protein QXI31_00065 [Archaeoglobaceae archaeon]